MRDEDDYDKCGTIGDVIDKGIDGLLEAEDILARIWRMILFDFAIKGDQMQGLLNSFQERELRGVDATSRRKTSVKANLSRNLASKTMSWKILMRGFRVMQFSKVTLRLELTRGKTTREIKLELLDD